MDGLRITFTLARHEAIFGESIPFGAVISHTFKTPLSVNALDPTNRALKIFLLKADGEERSADQMSPIERDGIYVDVPRIPEGTSLAPGKSLELKDDLLTWFGHIPPGTYRVWAEYHGILRLAVSETLDLRITPAVILSANTPRWGLQHNGAPYTASWAHRHEKGTMLFYQQQSPYLPRNARHCARTVVVTEQVSAQASCCAHPDHPVGHLYWFNAKQKFFFVPIDVRNAKAGPPVEVKKLPFTGWPIASGLSLKDGSFLVPFMEYRRTRCAVLHVLPTGVAQSWELDLGKNTPLGPHACFFEHDLRMHFVWTKSRGRQVDYAMLSIDDMESGFATRTIHISNDPILWFDMYLDRTIPVMKLRSLYLGEKGIPGAIPEDDEPPPQKVMAWCVVIRQGRIVCTPVIATDGAALHPVSFSSGGASGLSVISSVVTSQHGLCLLLADENGRLLYASTMRRRVQPLDQIIGIPLTQGHYPSLMKGSEYPWVHLRFVTDGKMINYVRLEPEEEPDPVESETRPWDLEPEEEVVVEEEFDDEEDQARDEE
ncbi:MAG: hypothetical protein ACP5G0_03560 [Desulfomonilia bacterium]